jgi:hypothetical protein
VYDLISGTKSFSILHCNRFGRFQSSGGITGKQGIKGNPAMHRVHSRIAFKYLFLLVLS